MADEKPTDERTPRTPKKERFLAAYAETGNVTLAAEACLIGRRTVYEWRDDDPEFAKAMDEAKEVAIDRLEEEARRRAAQGVRRPVYQGKELVGYVQDYSDTLLIFLLKGARPDKYRENIRTEHTGEINVNGILPQGEVDAQLKALGIDPLTYRKDPKPEEPPH